MKNANTQAPPKQAHPQQTTGTNDHVNYFGAGISKEDFLW